MSTVEGQDPVIARLVRVARALGRVVLIGGSIAPFLHVEPLIRRPRPTDDVDGVVDAPTYAAHGKLQHQLRAAGFTEAIHAGGHAHRWRSPDGDLVDLVPTGAQLGSTGQEWDVLALNEFDVQELQPGIRIRRVRASLFLAMKLAAFRDRGRDDPLYSSDLEDILALVLCRPGIVQEIGAGRQQNASFVQAQLQRLMTDFAIEDLAAAHLTNAYLPAAAIEVVRSRLTALVETPN